MSPTTSFPFLELHCRQNFLLQIYSISSQFFTDPCNETNACVDSNSACVNMGNKTTACRCNKGYYKGANDTCVQIKVAYSVSLSFKHSFYFAIMLTLQARQAIEIKWKRRKRRKLSTARSLRSTDPLFSSLGWIFVVSLASCPFATEPGSQAQGPYLYPVKLSNNNFDNFT